MVRLVIEFLVSILLISVVRAVVRFLMQSFGSYFRTPPPARQQPTRGSNLPLTGELKRDPVCGTYTVAATSLQQTVNGETHYFCSARCRDEFMAAVRR